MQTNGVFALSMAMAIPKKKTESTTSRFASRPQADRRVEAPAGATREPSYQEVSRRAFEIWEQNGREPGHDLENWLKAETELRHAAPSL